MQVVKRSENPITSRYTLETRAPNGEWYKDMSSNSKDEMMLHGHFLEATYGKSYRVVDELA